MLFYYVEYFSQGYGQTKEAFRALTNADIFNTYVTNHDFGSPNEGKNIGYNLCVSYVQYQKNLESAQPINVEFKFSKKLPAGIYGYALVLTNQLVSIRSEGQLHLDLS